MTIENPYRSPAGEPHESRAPFAGVIAGPILLVMNYGFYCAAANSMLGRSDPFLFFGLAVLWLLFAIVFVAIWIRRSSNIASRFFAGLGVVVFSSLGIWLNLHAVNEIMMVS